MCLLWGEAAVNPLQQAKQFYKAHRAWLGEGGKPSPNAQARADVCLKCRHNQPSTSAMHRLVSGVAKWQVELKGKMALRVDGEEALYACDLCDCPLALKVHVPLKVVRENTPDWTSLLPSNCWIKYDHFE